MLNSSTKSEILEEFAKALIPHYLTEVRDTEFNNHIADMGKIREGY